MDETIKNVKEILGEALITPEQLKEEILKKSHLEESSELTRRYFDFLGIEFKDIKMSDYYKLSEFIQDEINPLVADKEFHMVTELRMHDKIKTDKYGVYLFTDGSYFNKREAVSFYNPENNDKEDLLIGLCGWASGCNRIPYIVGFIKWCDWMKDKGVKHETIK